MNSTIRAFMALLVITLSFAGCGSAPKPSPELYGTLSIGMVADDGPDAKAARAGAEDAARRLSSTTGRNVVIEWNDSGESAAVRLAQSVGDGVDALIVGSPDGKGLAKAIDAAADRGIPSVCLAYDEPDSKRVSFIGPDEERAGARLVGELVGITGGTANIAVLAGPAGKPYLADRVRGIEGEAKRHKGLRIVGTYTCGEKPDEAADAVLRANKENPSIDAWVMAGGWALRTRALSGLPPDRYRIVSMDALPPQLDYVDKGVVPVLLARPMYDWGYMAVNHLFERMINGGKRVLVGGRPLVRVTRTNLGEWARRLNEWGYAGVREGYLGSEPAAGGGRNPANEAPETGTGNRSGA